MTDIKTNDIDRLFRKSYGRIVSLLLSRYGTTALEEIENAVMEAYYKALKTWPYNEAPDKPKAWLYRVASNHLLDTFKKNKREVGLDDQLNLDAHLSIKIEAADTIDPELKLLFMICHPSLKKEEQISFMLKTLSGFGNREISHALMTPEATIKKRLLRARKRIKEEGIAFDWPNEKALSGRLQMVHHCLYLLFNEGFYSNHPEKWLRKDLCLEAIRLCKYLSEHRLGNYDTDALLSLMCYHISRYEARLDESENIILLNDQDRSKWDPYFINLGSYYLRKSATATKNKTRYQLEAFASALHCNATSLETTDWTLLKEIYQALYKLEQQSLVLLNLIIVHLQLNEIEEAKRLYDGIDENDFKTNRVIYLMTGIDLYSKLKDLLQIEVLIEKAIQSTSNKKEESLIREKLKNHNY